MKLGMTVRRLLRELDSRELTDWMAFEHLEPWGGRVEDWRWAKLMALVHNRTIWGNEPPKAPDDYMPDLDGTRRRRRQLSLAESKAAGRALAAGTAGAGRRETVDEEIDRLLRAARGGVA